MLWKYITHTSEPPKPNLPDSAYAGIRFSYEPDEECLHGKVLKYHLPIETETGDGLFEVLCPNYDSEKIEKKNCLPVITIPYFPSLSLYL